ncbi:MAG: glutaredoxin family protein [bacterium]|nr:glutaredoxin family protein [bacterium]
MIFKPKIKIYSTPICHFCDMVKQYLKEKDFEFTDIDVSLDEKALYEMQAKTGQLGVPVIEIDEKTIIIGFDTANISMSL